MTRMSGYCIDANDLYWRLNEDMSLMHGKCKTKDCPCWHHVPGKRQTKEPPVEPKGTRKTRVTVAKQTVDTILGQPKLNKDGTVPKRRGRPKGSKNKVKVNA